MRHRLNRNAGGWLRRVSFDLSGLPPTPEEIRDFENDTSPEAYDRVVARLLDSFHFGQHLAVSWLDLARYADSYGYQADLLCNTYPYRDWVVDAINRNLPYDQFLTEQLAGDLLPRATTETRIATAFNRLHRQTNEGGSLDAEWRLEYAADRVKTFGTAMLGLTLECARCHDHKFDPISTRDYYSLLAFFNSIDEFGTYNDATHIPTPTIMLPTDPQKTELDKAQEAVDLAIFMWTINEETAPKRFNDWKLSGAQPTPLEPIALINLDQRDDQQQFDNRASRRGSPAKTSPANKSVEGKFGQALQFSGDDSLVVPAFPLTVAQPFSVAFWMKLPAGESMADALLWHQTTGTDTGFSGTELTLVDGRLRLAMNRFWPGNSIAIETQNTLPTDVWLSVVATYDGSGNASGLRLFVDGRRRTEGVRDHLYKSPSSGENVTFGERFRTRGAAGITLDEIAIYDAQLSKAEVMEFDRSVPLIDLWDSLDEQTQLQFFILRADKVAAEIRQQRCAAVEKLFSARDGVLELMVMEDLPQARRTYVRPRGRYDAPQTPDLLVKRDTPGSLPRMQVDGVANRLDLARWLTDPDQPLTGRVAVNRIWQNFFGKGLVETSENFGVQGTGPSHPELLDWLARDFVDNGWDVKRLCRKIVLSATYRQLSAADGDLRERDPANHLLARGPAHRLSAEEYRDAALWSSGLMDDRLGGPPVSPYQPPGLWTESNSFSPPYKQSSGRDLYRRSLYSVWKRTSPPPNMLAWDAPDRETCIARRSITNTPISALVGLNDPQFVEAANALAVRVWGNAEQSDQERLDEIFLRLAGRRSTAKESKIILRELEFQRDLFAKSPTDAATLFNAGSGTKIPEQLSPTTLAPWSVVVQIVMNSDACVWER